MEKKDDTIKFRCRTGLKRELIKIAHDNGSDLSKVVVDALEEFAVKAKGKKIVRKIVLKKK